MNGWDTLYFNELRIDPAERKSKSRKMIQINLKLFKSRNSMVETLSLILFPHAVMSVDLGGRDITACLLKIFNECGHTLSRCLVMSHWILNPN
jgi:hypothetical protein